MCIFKDAADVLPKFLLQYVQDYYLLHLLSYMWVKLRSQKKWKKQASANSDADYVFQLICFLPS